MEKIPYLGQTLIRWRVGGLDLHGAAREGRAADELEHGDGRRLGARRHPLAGGLGRRGLPQGARGQPDPLPLLRPHVRPRRHRLLAGRAGRAAGDAHARLRKAGRVPHGPRRRRAGSRPCSSPATRRRRATPSNTSSASATASPRFGLTCNLSLENLGDEPLPWSAGHHFYFTLPWSEGSARGDYLIRIAAGERLRQDAAGKLVAGPALGTVERMDNRELIDTFHTALRSPEAVFGEKGQPGDVASAWARRRRPRPAPHS